MDKKENNKKTKPMLPPKTRVALLAVFIFIAAIYVSKINLAFADQQFLCGDEEYKLSSPSAPSLADINSDFEINALDFDILKLDFQKLTANLANPKSDINADGQATVKDAGILMSGWR